MRAEHGGLADWVPFFRSNTFTLCSLPRVRISCFSFSAWTAALVRAPPLGELMPSSLLCILYIRVEAGCLLPIPYVMLGSVVWSHH